MEVEWTILGDYAHIAEGKLYLQGGGWERLNVNTGFPVRQQIGIAQSILVPWDETNQPIDLEIEIQTADGASLLKGKNQVKVGRPPDHPPGMPIRAMSASNIFFEFKEPGSYVLLSTLNGAEAKRTPFYIIPGPLLAMKQHQAGQGGGDPPTPQ